MINTIEFQNNTIIKPLERKRNELKKKAYNTKFLKKYYMTILERYEKLLYEEYIKLGKIIESEFEHEMNNR